MKRLDTGMWDEIAQQPYALNAVAADQGASANQFFGLTLQPSFVAFKPAPYPRPFYKGSPIPN